MQPASADEDSRKFRAPLEAIHGWRDGGGIKGMVCCRKIANEPRLRPRTFLKILSSAIPMDSPVTVVDGTAACESNCEAAEHRWTRDSCQCRSRPHGILVTKCNHSSMEELMFHWAYQCSFRGRFFVGGYPFESLHQCAEEI